MSFQPPSVKQETQNRKILEEIAKKQQALKQPNTASGNLTIKSMKNSQVNNPTAFNQMEMQFGHHLVNPQHSNGHQREKALNYALQNSFGNYISQDSSFGNQIIPVLPMFN